MSAELRALIREVGAENPDADPWGLAKAVAAVTPRKALHGFYEECLVLMIRDVWGASRTTAMSNALAKSSAPARSAKVAERSDWWSRMLAQRVAVGDKQWKLLGDCTATDLEFCISERQTHIARVQEQIALYDELVSLLHKHKVKTVAELPKGAIK